MHKSLKIFYSLHAINYKLYLKLFLAYFLTTFTSFLPPYFASRIISTLENSAFIAPITCEFPLLGTHTFTASSIAIFYTLCFFLSACAYSVIDHCRFFAHRRSAAFLHDNLGSRILEKLPTFDNNFRKEIATSSILNSALSDISNLQSVPDIFPRLIANLLSMLMSCIIIILISPPLGLISVIISSFALMSLVFHLSRQTYHSKNLLNCQDKLSDLYSETIDGYKEVHAFNLKSTLSSQLSEYLKKYSSAYQKKSTHLALARTFSPLIFLLIRLFSYLFCAKEILAGTMEISTLVLIISYYENLLNSFDSVSETLFDFFTRSVSIGRIAKLLNYVPPRPLHFGKNTNDHISGEIEFQHIDFSYDEKPILRDLNLKIAPRTFNIFVGHSGAGKSTLFRLLLRLEKPTRGKILLDGINIRNFTPEVYATNVSAVLQRPFIFDLTIRENLALIDPDFDHIQSACKAVGLHEAILSLPKGYDTKLVANARNLSAGEKKLLALARALLSKSEVLIFDEVTAGLDNQTAKKIVSILKTLKSTHTILMIAHNKTLISCADKIHHLD
ncbi:MAG: ABC transporter ATP-binding protein [Candidatus Saccharibacteria bacterium]|nr:ABC transporter ATP-binding protein [Candidatus Saccharibacteria bacterium]